MNDFCRPNHTRTHVHTHTHTHTTHTNTHNTHSTHTQHTQHKQTHTHSTHTQTHTIHTYMHICIYTVEPWLSESPLSEPSVIQTLFRILKYQEMIGFSAKASNKWNAYVIFRLVRLIVSWYSEYKSILACAILSAAHVID